MAYSFTQKDAQQLKWRPSRSAALECLRGFLPKASNYAATRNYDLPEDVGVSQLSPYIRYRLITEREVAESTLDVHSYSAVSKFIEEVCWRTYWKGYLEIRPGIWERYLHQLDELKKRLEEDRGLAERFAKASSGSTGIDGFDSWVLQLKTTGWLHNHTRMWFASIWIFTLRLPWQLGAAFFLEHLLDGDPASNTLSWRWVAGLHTPGKHYLARASNIAKFTGERFNPTSQLNESANALPVDDRVPTQALAEVASLRDMAFPSLSSCPAGLLVFPEDLYPEGSELKESPFCSICLLDGKDVRDLQPRSPLVHTFIQGAIKDAAARLAEHWDAQLVLCDGTVAETASKASPENVGRSERMRLYTGSVDQWVEGVLAWIRNENLNSVWLLRPSIGPWLQVFDTLLGALEGSRVQVMQYRRRWDAVHWPHATHGYFRFKEGLQGRVERTLSKAHQPDLF